MSESAAPNADVNTPSQASAPPEASAPAAAAPAAAAPVAGSHAGAPRITVDDSRAVALYSNFCRVTGTSEELIVDFGLNPRPGGVPAEAIGVSQRIVMNHFAAKRLWRALGATLERHESVFGALELDPQRRARPAPVRANAAG